MFGSLWMTKYKRVLHHSDWFDLQLNFPSFCICVSPNSLPLHVPPLPFFFFFFFFKRCMARRRWRV